MNPDILPIVPTVAAALAAVNLAAFGAFGWDKHRARSGGWRVPEGTLLLLALAGGTPGAFAARRGFRHKTRKQPFVTQLWTVVLLQAAGIAAAGWYLVR